MSRTAHMTHWQAIIWRTKEALLLNLIVNPFAIMAAILICEIGLQQGWISPYD